MSLLSHINVNTTLEIWVIIKLHLYIYKLDVVDYVVSYMSRLTFVLQKNALWFQLRDITEFLSEDAVKR